MPEVSIFGKNPSKHDTNKVESPDFYFLFFVFPSNKHTTSKIVRIAYLIAFPRSKLDFSKLKPEEILERFEGDRESLSLSRNRKKKI